MRQNWLYRVIRPLFIEHLLCAHSGFWVIIVTSLANMHGKKLLERYRVIIGRLKNNIQRMPAIQGGLSRGGYILDVEVREDLRDHVLQRF